MNEHPQKKSPTNISRKRVFQNLPFPTATSTKNITCFKPTKSALHSPVPNPHRIKHIASEIPSGNPPDLRNLRFTVGRSGFLALNPGWISTWWESQDRTTRKAMKGTIIYRIWVLVLNGRNCFFGPEILKLSQFLFGVLYISLMGFESFLAHWKADLMIVYCTSLNHGWKMVKNNKVSRLLGPEHTVATETKWLNQQTRMLQTAIYLTPQTSGGRSGWKQPTAHWSMLISLVHQFLCRGPTTRPYAVHFKKPPPGWTSLP